MKQIEQRSAQPDSHVQECWIAHPEWQAPSDYVWTLLVRYCAQTNKTLGDRQQYFVTPSFPAMDAETDETGRVENPAEPATESQIGWFGQDKNGYFFCLLSEVLEHTIQPHNGHHQETLPAFANE